MHSSVEPPTRLPAEILAQTPSGRAKLLAVWDGLCVETQISVLLSCRGSALPRHLVLPLADKAFTSPNAFIRYLAYRDIYLSDSRPDDVQRLQALQADPSPLVQSVLTERRYLMSVDLRPERFWRLSHSARLGIVRGLRRRGEEIASIVKAGLTQPELLVSVEEVYDVVADYVGSDCFWEVYGYASMRSEEDGMSAYLTSKDLDALWSVFIGAPPIVQRLLVAKLPADQVAFFAGIPANVLDGLSDDLLSVLMLRKDVALVEQRRSIYEAKERPDWVLHAATSAHFEFPLGIAANPNG